MRWEMDVWCGVSEDMADPKKDGAPSPWLSEIEIWTGELGLR